MKQFGGQGQVRLSAGNVDMTQIRAQKPQIGLDVHSLAVPVFQPMDSH